MDSLAISLGASSFALGTHLRLSKRDGQLRWQVEVPGGFRAVNISGGGQIVVAALGDGTLRWHDITEDRENLAVFPHTDRKPWLGGTSSGYYQA